MPSAAPCLLIRLLRRPSGAVCLSVLALLYLLAAFAPFLSPYSIAEQDLSKNYHPPTALLWKDGQVHVQLYQKVDPFAMRYEPVADESAPLRFWQSSPPYRLLGLIPMRHRLLGLEPSASDARLYLLGSDATGRDVFSRLLHGAQISLSISLIGIAITLSIGFIVGGLSAYFGGGVDFFAMRLVEFLMAIPGLYLLLALRSVIAEHFSSGQMFLMIVIILACIGWSGAARIIRGMALSIRRRPFVLAAESMGQSTWKILYKHLLPNLSHYLLVAAALSIPGYILAEAALSFLGLGIQEPSASWGLMLSQAQEIKVFMLNFWWLLTPGMAIFITVLAFNRLADLLRDCVDPQLAYRR